MIQIKPSVFNNMVVVKHVFLIIQSKITNYTENNTTGKKQTALLSRVQAPESNLLWAIFSFREFSMSPLFHEQAKLWYDTKSSISSFCYLLRKVVRV